MALDILQTLSDAETTKPDDKLSKKINDLIKDLIKTDQEEEHVINYLTWLAPKVGLDANKLTVGK